MSTNIRNEYRNGFMRNFSKFVIERYIIVDGNNMSTEEKNCFVSDINEALWYAIQQTNLYVTNRILPFVIVRRVEETNDKLRIIINDIGIESEFKDYEPEHGRVLDKSELSHLINFKTVPPRRQIQVSDHLIPGNAKMLIGRPDEIAAAVDIFLDIAMFNSIDFLRSFDLQRKKDFSQIKYDFAQKHNFRSYYKCCEEDPPSYWSFAFSARKDCKDIDYYSYVSFWDLFLKETYPDKHFNQEPINPPCQQMKYHRDLDNLPKEMQTPKYWEHIPKGDYLVLRTNKEPNDSDRKMIICQLFGIPKFHIGAIKIIPTNDRSLEFIYHQMRELYISAFKVVV